MSDAKKETHEITMDLRVVRRKGSTCEEWPIDIWHDTLQQRLKSIDPRHKDIWVDVPVIDYRDTALK